MKLCVTTFIFSIVFVSAASFSAIAQTSVNDFLLTAFEDRNLATYDDQINFLKPKRYRLPVIDELEFRISNDELTYDDLQYAIRLNPGNPWKIRRNNALFNATKKELSLRKQLEFKDNLFDRYELLLDFIYSKDLSDLIQRELSIIEKKATIFEENFESNLFDAEDFVDVKIDQIDGIQAFDQSLLEMNENKSKINSILNNSLFDWASFDIISVSTIDSISNEIGASSFSSTELELIAQRAEVARQEVRTERADFNLGFIQSEYAPFRNNDDSEIGFSVGITIPIFRDNRPQIAERILDEIELKNELEIEQYRDSVQKILAFEQLKNLIHLHQRVVDQVEELDLEALTVNLSRSSNYDPLSVLKLERGIVKLDELILKSRQRVLEQYLEFLFIFDVTSHQPLTNYLSDRLENIE